MTLPAPGRGGLDEGAARILVVVDGAVPLAVHEACADLAASLAERAGLPVTLASIPACCVDGLRPALTRAQEARTWEFTPAPAAAPMSSAPFLWEGSHHGHRHGAGTGHHSHGPPRGPSAGA